MTEDETRANAESDPDAVVSGRGRRSPLRPVPDPGAIRTELGLTQEAFAEAFGIPLGTVRDWEERRRHIDATGRALLRAIAFAPEAVRAANQPDTPDQRESEAIAE